MDSDTLTLAPVREVIDAYRKNRSFSSTTEGQRLVTLDEASRAAQREPARPDRCRNRLLKAAGPADVAMSAAARHLPASARGLSAVRRAEGFSLAMIDLIGAKWLEWGSEQVASTSRSPIHLVRFCFPTPSVRPILPNSRSRVASSCTSWERIVSMLRPTLAKVRDVVCSLTYRN